MTWSFNDGNGHSVTQTQDIIITDTTAPTALTQNISVTLDGNTGDATITADQINNGSSDNCGAITLSIDNSIFNCADIGINTVLLTVKDASGNEASKTAVVTIIDSAANSSVTIPSDDADNEICYGENLTFTAIPVDGGDTPTYEWYVDGISQGVSFDADFTPFMPLSVGVHDVYVEMQSSLSTCTIPKQSNSVSVIVHPIPVINGSSALCENSTKTYTSDILGGKWALLNNAGTNASVNPNTGLVDAGNVAGIVKLEYTLNGCKSSFSITINTSPVVNAPPKICVNETNILTQNTGGTWISNDPGIATVNSSTGEITGIVAGNVSFTFTDTNGCNTTTNSVEVLAIPVITSITASKDAVCVGESSTLTANVLGAGGNVETIVDYNFNSGNDYNQLIDSSTSLNVNSNFFSPDNSNYIPFNTGAGNPGRSIMQMDNWRDDRRNNGFPDDGLWRLHVDGSYLPNYKSFSISFNYRRATRFGYVKSIIVEYRFHNGTGWSNWESKEVRVNSESWQMENIALSQQFNNPDQLQFRFKVNDGSYSGWYGTFEPHIYIDNLKIQATESGDSYKYAWTADTGNDGGLTLESEISASNNFQITVNPLVTTNYTLTATNIAGCPSTKIIKVNVLPSPEIVVTANYCPTDNPNTSRDESNMVQLSASANQSIAKWEWNTGETSNTVYVDIAGQYQVIGTTANGCSESASLGVAQELVVDGSFSNFDKNNITFQSDYTFREDVPGLVPAGQGELYDDTIGPSYVNGYSITTDGNNVHTNFHGTDHTNDAAAGNFMAVNGHGTQYVVWSQTVYVEADFKYYFSAWARSLNNAGPYAKLRFRVNGVQVGSQLNLESYPTKGWDRFYGNWTSQITGPILIEIINNENSFGGNDFGLDDISFGTLSTFITLTSYLGSDNQTICQNTTLDEITYNVGGGLAPPTITGLPSGLDYTFNGIEFAINGTPTEFGTFTYTIDSNASCGSKTASGTITVEEAPVVTINTEAQTVCYTYSSISLDVSLSGSATVGDSGSGWTSSGAGIFDDPYSLNPIYTISENDTGTITFTFTSNVPSGTCNAAIETVAIEITPSIGANPGVNQITANCSETTVTLAANDVSGQWTVTSDQPSGTYFFSDSTLYNSKFTGESGETYRLQWEATNVAPCDNTAATMTVTIPNCETNLIFDGVDDNISFADNYGLSSGAFSIEAWIKPKAFLGTQTIISKRNASSLNTGYDFSLINDRLYFRWNNKEMFSNQPMNAAKWYHVVVTFNGSNTYTLYIDGFVVQTFKSGASPSVNSNNAIVGAMDRTNNSPINYFGGGLNGGIDEVRIWEINISEAQIREMMNQEIKSNGNAVSGVVVPLNINGLQWTDLIGYYQMRVGSQTSVLAGIIEDISATPIPGKLNRMNDNQLETAPIPYMSSGNGSWDTQATWRNGVVQQIPNSKLQNIIPAKDQTWNIVRTASDVTSGNRLTTVLGLIVDNNYKLTITGTGVQDHTNQGNGLWVTHYLKIDGKIDLVGESQLVQKRLTQTQFSESFFEPTSKGYIERDQQGTGNPFNYNYWGSPVSPSNATVTNNNLSINTFTIGGVLRAGTTPTSNPIIDTPITWIAGHNPNPVSNGNVVQLTTRWLATYSNNISNKYSEWKRINNNTDINIGLGYTMKGSGGGDSQNYVFVGKPNNGVIMNPISIGNDALIGNPYPSAIDAIEFIRDNIPTINPDGQPSTANLGSSATIDGSLSFWEHYEANNTHILRDYLGGYATFNLTGGLTAVTPGKTIDGYVQNIASKGTRKPGRFVPVGQGFFVTAVNKGQIIFRNSQRVFRREGASNSINDGSVFFRPDSLIDTNPVEDDIKRVSLKFKSPEGGLRPLLLGFTPNNEASEGIDYGYDALNNDALPSDLLWLINESKYVIQGVGQFDDAKKYPFAMQLAKNGTIEIKLTELENFTEAINVYVYDSQLGTYHQINNTSFTMSLDAGDYDNRFYLVFKDDKTLSIIYEDFKNVVVKFLRNTDEIFIQTPNEVHVKQVYLVNIIGQTVQAWNATNTTMSNEMKIPVKNLPDGNYVVKIQTDSGIVNKKIVLKF